MDKTNRAGTIPRIFETLNQRLASASKQMLQASDIPELSHDETAFDLLNRVESDDVPVDDIRQMLLSYFFPWVLPA